MLGFHHTKFHIIKYSTPLLQVAELNVPSSRFEATDNEHASITGKHYPYILFYPAAPGAEGIKFEGEPSLKVEPTLRYTLCCSLVARFYFFCLRGESNLFSNYSSALASLPPTYSPRNAHAYYEMTELLYATQYQKGVTV